ncbi:MAG TPA: tRNA lysidine(34) synthetase TilS [Pyrinomonadaceae bacterium]|jgi:tRNA(Ile)-lysidine synthase
MNNFVRNLLTEWRRLNLPCEDETFVVAVSGGADSLSLALALDDLKKRKKLNLRFVVAHFNHNLRGAESEADEKFVKDLAAEYDFELALGRGDISEKGNLEQSARVARYDFLTGVAENLRARGVLTAHTINDQAETFLLNLIRGSGIEGLSAMKPLRLLERETRRRGDAQTETQDLSSNSALSTQHSALILVRPLLGWAKRSDTENYCHAEKIEYRYDSMNEDLAFRRVRIRRVLLPLLQDFNPKIIARLAATAALLRDEHDELEKLANHQLNQANKDELPTRDLTNLSPAIRRRVLRAWLASRRGDLRRLDLKHLEAVERLIFSRKSGRFVELPGGETVVKTNGKLVFK